MQDHLLTARKIREVATIFEMGPLGRWVGRVEVFFDLLCDHTLVVHLKGGERRGGEKGGRKMKGRQREGGEGDEGAE